MASFWYFINDQMRKIDNLDIFMLIILHCLLPVILGYWWVFPTINTERVLASPQCHKKERKYPRRKRQQKSNTVNSSDTMTASWRLMFCWTSKSQIQLLHLQACFLKLKLKLKYFKSKFYP